MTPNNKPATLCFWGGRLAARRKLPCALRRFGALPPTCRSRWRSTKVSTTNWRIVATGCLRNMSGQCRVSKRVDPIINQQRPASPQGAFNSIPPRTPSVLVYVKTERVKWPSPPLRCTTSHVQVTPVMVVMPSQPASVYVSRVEDLPCRSSCPLMNIRARVLFWQNKVQRGAGRASMGR